MIPSIAFTLIWVLVVVLTAFAYHSVLSRE